MLATYLVDKGYMTAEQAEAVVREQVKALPGMRDQFGKIAVRMGFITAPNLEKAIQQKEKEETGK
jgi:polyhydroxyalkanoate synthesis regulator phasin